MGALTCYQHAKLRQEALVHGFWPAPVIPNQLELLLDSRREASFALKRCFCDMTGDCERGMRTLGIRNLAICDLEELCHPLPASHRIARSYRIVRSYRTAAL